MVVVVVSPPLLWCVGASGIAHGDVGTLQYVPTFTSISPSVGSTLGGSVVTLTGTGMSPNASITIGSGVCHVVVEQTSPTSLVCVTSSPDAGAGSYAVVYDTVASPLSFVYASASTPTVVSFTPTAFSTAISQVVTVTVTVADTTPPTGAVVTFGDGIPCLLQSVSAASQGTLSIVCSVVRGAVQDRTSSADNTQSAAIVVSVFPFGAALVPNTVPLLDRRVLVSGLTSGPFGTAGGGQMTVSGLGFSPSPELNTVTLSVGGALLNTHTPHTHTHTHKRCVRVPCCTLIR